jgi:sporulation protein YlmC with PRC-barrel domain
MERGEPMQAVGPRSSFQPRTTSIGLRSRARAAILSIDERGRSTMSKIVLIVFTSLVIAAGAADAVAQTAGSMVSVSTTELREVAMGWSAKKQILGKSVYNDTGEKVGDINDLIVTPDKAVSYAIVGVGGFLGVGEHEIAVPVGQLKQLESKIVLSGATKDALKAAPKFEYAK